MAKEIVVCDDDVDVMSITISSKKKGKSQWAVGLFDITGIDKVHMPEMLAEPLEQKPYIG